MHMKKTDNYTNVMQSCKNAKQLLIVIYVLKYM